MIQTQNRLENAGQEELPAIPIYDLPSRILSKSQTIVASRLGRAAIAGGIENLSEFAGYDLGGRILAPVGKIAGSLIGRQIGEITSLGLSAILAGHVTNITYSKTQHLKPVIQKTLSFMTFFLLFHFFNHLCDAPFSEYGESLGKDLGELFMYYSGGILLAFAAIKFCDSEEILWDQNNIIRTYPFKALQSMALGSCINSCGLFSSDSTLDSIGNFALSSLTYNALDLIELFQRAKNGRLLDEIPAFPLRRECFRRSVERTLRDRIVAPRISSFLIPNANRRRDLISRAAIDGVQQAILRHANTSALERLDQSLPPISSFLVPERNQCQDLIAKAAIDALQEATTAYATILLENSDLLEQMKSSHTAHLIKDLSIEKSFILLVRSTNLYFQLLSTYPNGFESIAFYQQALERAQMRPSRLQLETAVGLFPLLPASYIDTATNHLINWTSHLEVQAVGFEFFSERRKEESKKHLKNHIEWILKLTPFSMGSTMVQELEIEEIRQFYKNLNFLLFHHYSLLNKPVSIIAKKFINHQITHSNLSTN